LVNADEIRDVRFLSGGGYDASQVDELLRRVAVELDAGRPVGPLIANATFRPGQGRDGYGIEGVDWFLEQLLHRDDSSHSARMGADPWRHLAVANHFTCSGPDAVAGITPCRHSKHPGNGTARTRGT
jgi:DivIVA domain-containing protein